MPKESIRLMPSEAFEVAYYLPLETNDSCLLSRIQTIIFENDLLFILDDNDKVITIFDHTGEFINRIQHAGNGPNEYYRIGAFDVKDSLIYIQDDVRNRILSYSFDGQWVGTKDLAVRFETFHILPNNCYFMVTGHSFNEFLPSIQNHDYLLGYPDSLIIRKGFHRNEARNKLSDQPNPWEIIDYMDTLLFLPRFGQSIYQLTPEYKIRERYRILFDKPVTEEALERADPGNLGRDISDQGYQFLGPQWFETPEYTSFGYTNPKGSGQFGYTTLCYYSKKRRTVLAYKSSRIDPTLPLPLSPITTYKNLFVAAIWPNEISQRIERTPAKKTNDPEVLRLLAQVKEDDNPVLIFFKVKENNPLF
ncbi:MAG: 6-bladed beta-propeller [Bacteroidales bacterium]